MHWMCPVNQEWTRSWWVGPAVNWQAPSRASQAPTGIQLRPLCVPSGDAAPLQTRTRDPSMHLTRRTFLSSFLGVRRPAAPPVKPWQKKKKSLFLSQCSKSSRRRELLWRLFFQNVDLNEVLMSVITTSACTGWFCPWKWSAWKV